MQEGALALFAD